jgi:oxalate decarboxylase/phosphoglucose isomerase-like protein (cupin superfamily)
MKIISRRSVFGIAAGAVASGVVVAEAASQGNTAGEEGQTKADRPAEAPTDSVYKFRMGKAQVHHYGQSCIREHKLHDFPISASISASLIDLAAGAVREPHWHPNSDEWLFVMAGEIRMTIVDGEGVASQFDCGPEDVAFVPQGFGHYVENVGEATAKLMLIHNHADFTTVNLSEWVAGGSVSVFASTLNMPLAAFDDAPKERVFIGKKKVAS